MSFDWLSMINCEAKFSKLVGVENHNVTISSGNPVNDAMLCSNRSKKSNEPTDELITTGEKTFLGSSGKHKQPNTEMRENLFKNLSNSDEHMINKFKNLDIHELPCSKEGGKWAKIRMYQERAKRREARRRRQRQKEREESGGKKSRKKKRSKPRKKRKSRSRKKRGKGRRKSRSKSRKKSGRRRRKRSAKSTGRGRRTG